MFVDQDNGGRRRELSDGCRQDVKIGVVRWRVKRELKGGGNKTNRRWKQDKQEEETELQDVKRKLTGGEEMTNRRWKQDKQ